MGRQAGGQPGCLAGGETHPVPQIALIDLLTSLGLTPSGIVGHSLGEVACGYADGCLSQEEAVLAAYWRGQCIKEAHIPPGAMAAVGRHLPGRGPHLWERGRGPVLLSDQRPVGEVLLRGCH